MRIALKGLGLLFIMILAAYAYLLLQNNRTAPSPDRDTVRSTFEKSILWLEYNREKALAENNSILWRMIERAAGISNDKRLIAIFDEYKQRYLKSNPNKLGKLLFEPGSWIPVRYEDIASLPYYNQHFIYALLCDKDLEKIPSIAEQNDPDFCNKHPLRPACVTHQLMGIQLMQRSQCGDAKQLADTVKVLQERITKQLFYDPRVVDVYMQRVLMLVDTGASDRVKPAWIQNLVNAQQDDGGWSPFDPLFPVGGGRYFGFDRLFGIKRPASTFHMTAQGILLFSLLDGPQRE